ncbi:hypothetical protein AVEN_201100-1 [Araneus ventricosus]|uniref:Uncharacterized protein n=1 Tax=Araneus ventricosus TaxID=182803 RepID=A0A4Y2KMW6_ARAVE|nr:hypothetical protein AVEN_201100-1 [Araneus ventricosus]
MARPRLETGRFMFKTRFHRSSTVHMGLVYIQSEVEAQTFPVGVEWKFGAGGVASGVIIVISLWLKIMSILSKLERNKTKKGPNDLEKREREGLAHLHDTSFDSFENKTEREKHRPTRFHNRLVEKETLDLLSIYLFSSIYSMPS